MIPLADILAGVVSEHLLLLLCSILIIAAILITKVGARFGIPTLLLFLILGMVAGKDGLGFTFENYHLGESIGHFAMTIILFTAGLETSLQETRPVLKQGIILSSLGVFLTVLFTGFFIYLVGGGIIGKSLLLCFLLAAVMSSTDSASVFSVLRNKRLHLRENLGPMLELESGSNDPAALSLTLIFVDTAIKANSSVAGTGALALMGAGLFLLQIVVGVAVGLAIGYGAKWVLGKIHLTSSSLYSILILSVGFFANSFAEILYGNGLLALYIAAIILGNKVKLPYKKETLAFLDGMTWLMQLVMFLMLGLLSRPSHMLRILGPAILIGLFIMFVARPLSVLVCLAPFRKISFKAKIFTSWVGLKGAGPILFALAPVVAGLQGASEMFNIVFVITLLSLLVQGVSLDPVARRLNLCYDEDPTPETFGLDVPEDMGMLLDHVVIEEDLENGATLRDLKLPHGIRVMMVRRGDRFLVPHGSMPLQPGDKLVIIMGESDD